jgi:negative regulator of sigma E activity
VIVENGRDRQHYLPALNEIHAGPAMHDDAFDKLRFFLKEAGPKRLRILVGNGEPVAGFHTSIVSFMGQQGTIIQKIWIDDRTGLMLKRELYDPAGGLVGAFEFKSVNYSPKVRDDDFVIKAKAPILTQFDLARRAMVKAGMLAAFLPEEGGRRLIGYRLMDRNPASVVMVLTYDTGSTPLSLFQVKGTFEADRLNRITRGEFKTYTWQSQGRSFALIGDLDPDSLKRLADKVVVRPES